MKVCVHLRDPANGNLTDGNLRGESRWERQALGAVLQNPLVTDVYTSGHLWRGVTDPKYRGAIQPSEKDVIFIGHDWNRSSLGSIEWKAIFINIFAGPWQEQKAEVQSFVTNYQNRLIFTIGYQALLKTQRAYLKQFIPEENILCLPVPGAESVRLTNAFDNKILFWPYRILVLSAVYKAKCIRWAFEKLAQDSSLRLRIVTSWNQSEIRDLVGGDSVPIQGDLDDYFWSREETKGFSSVRSQVEIRNSQTHQQMLDSYAHSKLVIPHYRYFGGPGVEAAMFGVPFVGNQIFGAFSEMEGYIYTNTEDEQLAVFDRLMSDRDYYTSVANTYRNYIDQTYTFDAFNRNLNKILSDRNLL